MWVLPSSCSSIFCFYAFTPPVDTNVSHYKLLPFLILTPFSHISPQETLIDFAITSTDIWAMWHDAENQTVVKYINYEQYGSLTSVILPHPKEFHTQKTAFYVEPKSHVCMERIQPWVCLLSTVFRNSSFCTLCFSYLLVLEQNEGFLGLE